MMSDTGLDQDSELFRSATSISGKGDMGIVSPGGSKCVMRKFCNGVRVPVFLADGDGNDSNHAMTYRPESHRTQGGSKLKSQQFPFGQSDEDISLMDLYTCPICMDPMIEVTATSCGHTFCGACLEEWSKIKPICPICSKEVTHRIRLYNEDQFIEWLLRTNEDFPAELGRRLYEATKLRMDKRTADRKSGSILSKLREKLDDLRISCKSKGVCGTIRNQFYEPTALRIRGSLNSSASKAVPSERYGFLIWGIIIGILAAFTISKVWNANGTNFFYYLYLSIKNYDGTIPAHLVDQQLLGIEQTSGTPLSGEQSSYAIVSNQDITGMTIIDSENKSNGYVNTIFAFLRSILSYLY